MNATRVSAAITSLLFALATPLALRAEVVWSYDTEG